MPTFPELLALIKNLDSRVKVLEEKPICNCECKMNPYRISLRDKFIDQFFDGVQYDLAAIYAELNFGDRLPLDVCPGEKAEVFVGDATIYLYYHDTDGWVMENISRVNNYLS